MLGLPKNKLLLQPGTFQMGTCNIFMNYYLYYFNHRQVELHQTLPKQEDAQRVHS